MEAKRVKLTQKQKDILVNVTAQKEKLKNAFDLLTSQEVTVVELVAEAAGIDNLGELSARMEGDFLLFSKLEKQEVEKQEVMTVDKKSKKKE